MKNQLFTIALSIFLINSIAYSQGIYINPPFVKPGSFKKIVVDTFGVFNPDNRFVLKIKSSVTFSNDSLAGSPRYTNEFVNESFFVCTSNLAFCYQAPYPRLFPIKGEKRTIWKDTTTYEVYSTSPYRATNLLPIVSTTGDSLSYCYIPFGCKRDTIDVDTLSDNLNLANYIVPREATVHHYFKVEDTENKPVGGVIIKYKVGTSLIKESSPSDSLGLVDLAIKVGGNDANISYDDIIPAGTTKTISFYNVVSDVGNARIDTNNFKPFTISVLDKALPLEKEYGLVSGLKAGISIDAGGLFKVNGVLVRAGFARCGVGVSYRPNMIIKPVVGQETLWKTSIGTEYGLNASANFGPMFKLGIDHLAVGGVEASFGVEFEGKEAFDDVYFLNSASSRDRLYLMSELFEKSAKHFPQNLLLSNFLKRLINFTDLRVGEKATSKLSFGMSLNAGLRIDVGGDAELDLTEDLEEVPLGFGYGVFNDRTYNVETSNEYDNTAGITNAIRVSAAEKYNQGLSLGGNFSNLINDGLQIAFDFVNEEKNHSILLSRNFSKLNKALQYCTVEFSTDKEIAVNNNDYTLTKTNRYYFSKKALQGTLYNPFNFVSQYFNKGTFFSKNVTFSPLSLDANNAFHSIGRFQNQFLESQKSIIKKEDNYIESIREITKTSERLLSFEAEFLVGVDIGIGYTSWSKYIYPFRKFQYSRDFKRLLKTVDYPNIESNLELPNEDPFVNFVSNIGPMVASFPADVVQEAKNFVVEEVKSVVNSVVTFSNIYGLMLAQRLSLDAKPLNYSDKTTNANATPSAFTFTIPAGNQAFNTGTNLYFKYYYPENQLSAITASDTFKLVTDAFFLNAKANNTKINTAPNGNFTINTQFSNYELELAGLPTNLSATVLFLANGSQTWQVLGQANQNINFNKLGVFAIGVALPKDTISPVITVNPPASFVNGQKFTVSLTDNASGIDWSKTYFICNGKVIPYQRVGTSNAFSIDIALLHATPIQNPEIFDIQIRTSDLVGNKQYFAKFYPCKRSIIFLNILEGMASSSTARHQALVNIEVSGSAATKPPLELKAGKSIMLIPGFSTNPITGQYFKAEIGGCN